MAEPQGPKIQVDSDWKAQAQAEKERLAQQAKAAAAAASPAGGVAGRGAGAGAGLPPGVPAEGTLGGAASQAQGRGGAAGGRAAGLPPANFQTLVSSLATQALFAMGAVPDPRTGQRVAHLEIARHHIDMLAVVESKTKGNLAAEEADMLATTLYELRMRYIQLAQQAVAR